MAAILASLPGAAFASSSLDKLKAALHKCQEAEKLLQQVPPRFHGSKVKAQMFLHQSVEQLLQAIQIADHQHNPIHFIPAKHKSRHKKPKRKEEEEVKIIE